MTAHSSDTKQLLVGREGQLKQLFDDLNSQRSIRLIEGEAGIGKSALLEEFHWRLKQRDPSAFFVGFYSKDKALIGHTLIYPFVTVLEDLLKWAKETEQIDERIKGTTDRLEQALIKFAKEKGSEMVGAIIQDVAKKAGFEETANSEVVAAVKAALNERVDYEKQISILRQKHPKYLDLATYMNAIPKSFGTDGREMLSHTKIIMDNKWLAIHPRFNKLIVALRTATATDGLLHKAETAHNDLLDALRLSLQRFH